MEICYKVVKNSITLANNKRLRQTSQLMWSVTMVWFYIWLDDKVPWIYLSQSHSIGTQNQSKYEDISTSDTRVKNSEHSSQIVLICKRMKYR